MPRASVKAFTRLKSLNDDGLVVSAAAPLWLPVVVCLLQFREAVDRVDKAGCSSAFSDVKRLRIGRRSSAGLMGLLQLRYEHDSSTIRLRFERDTTSYEELCAFEQ